MKTLYIHTPELLAYIFGFHPIHKIKGIISLSELSDVVFRIKKQLEANQNVNCIVLYSYNDIIECCKAYSELFSFVKANGEEFVKLEYGIGNSDLDHHILGYIPFDELKALFMCELREDRSKEQEQKRKYKVITLCGSTRFKDEFLEAQKRLTLEGNIVISVGLFGHSGDNEVWSEGAKEMLDDMHKAKIDMSDEIFVINVGGYIGESTKSEIEYAQKHGKTVRCLEESYEQANG